jgi:hypothetical protein
VQLTVTTEYLGHTYKLTLEADVAEDLSDYNVKGRITGVLDRELQRCAEITAVALKDKTAAELAAHEARRAPKTREPKGPAMILAAGTKAPEGRIVLEATE